MVTELTNPDIPISGVLAPGVGSLGWGPGVGSQRPHGRGLALGAQWVAPGMRGVTAHNISVQTLYITNYAIRPIKRPRNLSPFIPLLSHSCPSWDPGSGVLGSRGPPGGVSGGVPDITLPQIAHMVWGHNPLIPGAVNGE